MADEMFKVSDIIGSFRWTKKMQTDAYALPYDFSDELWRAVRERAKELGIDEMTIWREEDFPTGDIIFSWTPGKPKEPQELSRPTKPIEVGSRWQHRHGQPRVIVITEQLQRDAYLYEPEDGVGGPGVLLHSTIRRSYEELPAKTFFEEVQDIKDIVAEANKEY